MATLKGRFVCHIDVETFSDVDLKASGADVYFESEHATIMCMAYAFDDEPIQLWVEGEPLPEELLTFVARNGIVLAYNAPFELAAWNMVGHKRWGWPELRVEQTYCVMAEAYAMALPGSLEGAAAALGLPISKDQKGGRIMRQLASPKDVAKDGTPIRYLPFDYPEKFQAMYEYCKNDVALERAVKKRTIPLSIVERRVWLMDYRINRRGIRVDVEAARQAQEVVDSEKEMLDLKMRKVTGNAVASCDAVGQLKEFVNDHGFFAESVDKDSIEKLLSREDIPPAVRTALECRQLGGKTSTAKLTPMVVGAGLDGRLRGMFQYSGAGTRRWAARRVQLQNLPRQRLKPKDIEALFSIIKSDAPAKDKAELMNVLYGSPMVMMSECLRGFLVPAPGAKFIAVDYNAIEARVLAWLAGEERVLEIFRSHGKIYEHAAAGIYRVRMEEISKEDPRRQVGKVAILALGYGGGKGAFQQMARAYGINVSDEEAESIKVAWRQTNPAIVTYWKDLETAAIRAVNTPGQIYRAGAFGREVCFKKSGSFLLAILPSGGTIVYPYPRIEEKEVPWGGTKPSLTYMCVNPKTKKWERMSTYGGSISENCTQSLARDLLAFHLNKLERADHEVVLHVHDEIVIEVPAHKEVSVADITGIMERLPAWAKELPLKAAGWEGFRYAK